MSDTKTLANNSVQQLLTGVQALQSFQISEFESAILNGISSFNSLIQQNPPFEEYLEPFLNGLHEAQLIEGSKESILAELPAQIERIHGQVGYLFLIGVSGQTRDSITNFIETFHAHLKAYNAKR